MESFIAVPLIDWIGVQVLPVGIDVDLDLRRLLAVGSPHHSTRAVAQLMKAIGNAVSILRPCIG